MTNHDAEPCDRQRRDASGALLTRPRASSQTLAALAKGKADMDRVRFVVVTTMILAATVFRVLNLAFWRFA
ncbi:MAG: hypothetical protein HY322_00535 [Betaproteobacteria bacterium]|nr:hypothetical protein [Betaproteobacteria bacterium]